MSEQKPAVTNVICVGCGFEHEIGDRVINDLGKYACPECLDHRFSVIPAKHILEQLSNSYRDRIQQRI